MFLNIGKRKRSTALFAGVAAAALVLSACGGSSSGGSGGGGSGDSKIVVGLAYDIGGRGDQSFNDSAAAGLDKAEKEFGFTAKEAEATDGETDDAKAERLRQLADEGANPIIAVGFAYAGPLKTVSAEYPKVHFAIVDSTDVTAGNISNLVFAENEGSFLVGVIAGLKTKTNNVGFVGGVQTPLIEKFQAGYVAGVKASNPAAKVQVAYISQPPDFSGFGDEINGQKVAKGQFDNGADVVFQAAGGSGGGVFKAAKAANGFAIGVDSDQYNTADSAVRDVIISSMLKRVDTAVYDFLSKENDGHFAAGTTTYDLKSEGVGYSTTGGKVDDIKTKVEDYKKQIIDGKITVPTAP
ncbi:MAG: nucleoside-binding protein [Pseudonocardiales bacterium]|nr:nucleoside-binding protein [Pseudonocardiales bacterium]